MYYKLFKFIGCVRNVRIGSFFNLSLYLYNALFEFLFVMHNQKLDFTFFEPFIYNEK